MRRVGAGWAAPGQRGGCAAQRRCHAAAQHLRWVKLRRKCENHECPRKTFNEWVPGLPPRCRITGLLREQAAGEVTGRGITPAEAAP